MQAVQSPIIPIVNDWIHQHPGTISLGQGIAYYGPPPEVQQFLHQFWQDPVAHQYQPVRGIPDLITAIETKLLQDNSIRVSPGTNAVIVTAGCNMAFLNAILAITQPGDEVILSIPYYFNHEMALGIAGCRAVLVETDPQYQLQPHHLEAAITPHTRAIVTISPNNPTGVVYPGPLMEEVNTLCRRHNLYHIHDETYEYFTYDGADHVSPAAGSDRADHTISLFSLSKAYGFASWRIGYMVVPAHLVEAVTKIQDTNLICPPVISQYAAVAALQVGASYCRQKLPVLDHVRRQAVEAFQAIADIVVVPPTRGSFYFLLRVNTDQTDLELVQRLIQDHRVAVIPGSTFGLTQGCYLRVAYGALDEQTAVTGITRLVQGLQHSIRP